MKRSKRTGLSAPARQADFLVENPFQVYSLPGLLGLVKGPGRRPELHSHSWVHLLFTVSVREGCLDLPVARLQAIQERGHGSHRHRVVLHRVPHIGGVQVLPLMGHNLGGLLTVQHGEICGHVDIHVVHGPLGQAAVGLGPCGGRPGP